MSTYTIEDNRIRLSLREEDDGLKAQVTDLKTGRNWRESDLVHIEIYEKMERRKRWIREFNKCSVEKSQSGLYVFVGNEQYEFSFGIYLRIEDGEIIVEIPFPEVYELKPQIMLIFSISCFPDTGHIASSGSMLLPLQSGVLVSPAKGKNISDRFLIYGEQACWELLPLLPVCSLCDNDGGLIFLATKGAGETECFVKSDSEGWGSMSLSFSFRRFWPDPLYSGERQIRIIPVDEKQDLLHATARRLRRHIIDDLGKPTLEQRRQESPEVDYLLDAFIMKTFHGMQPIGHASKTEKKDKLSSANPFVATLTFAETRAYLEKIRQAGVDKALIQCVGWNPRGHDGMWPSRFPIERRVGGIEEFRKLIAYGSSIGYQINVHDNFLSQYRSSPDFNGSIVIHDQWSQPDLRGFWGGGETYVTWPQCLGNDYMRAEMSRMKELGLEGMYYIDGMGNPLECNYNPVHAGARQEYADGVQRILQMGKNVFGAVGTECGFLYSAVPADCMVMCGHAKMLTLCEASSHPLLNMIVDFVPLWQLALHGLIVHENHRLAWKDIMDCVLYGSHPRDEWSARPDFHSALTEERIALIKKKYDVCLKQFGYLQTLEMKSWKHLDDHLYETIYEDGTTITADYEKEELFHNGQLIESSDYLS